MVAEGGRAVYGKCVESFPNFGMLYVPNSNLGHNSIILMIEAQSRYVNGLIREVLRARSIEKDGKEGTLVIQPKPAKAEEFSQEIQAELAKGLFVDPACNSRVSHQVSSKSC